MTGSKECHMLGKNYSKRLRENLFIEERCCTRSSSYCTWPVECGVAWTGISSRPYRVIWSTASRDHHPLRRIIESPPPLPRGLVWLGLDPDTLPESARDDSRWKKEPTTCFVMGEVASGAGSIRHRTKRGRCPVGQVELCSREVRTYTCACRVLHRLYAHAICFIRSLRQACSLTWLLFLESQHLHWREWRERSSGICSFPPVTHAA